MHKTRNAPSATRRSAPGSRAPQSGAPRTKPAAEHLHDVMQAGVDSLADQIAAIVAAESSPAQPLAYPSATQAASPHMGLAHQHRAEASAQQAQDASSMSDRLAEHMQHVAPLMATEKSCEQSLSVGMKTLMSAAELLNAVVVRAQGNDHAAVALRSTSGQRLLGEIVPALKRSRQLIEHCQAAAGHRGQVRRQLRAVQKALPAAQAALRAQGAAAPAQARAGSARAASTTRARAAPPSRTPARGASTTRKPSTPRSATPTGRTGAGQARAGRSQLSSTAVQRSAATPSSAAKQQSNLARQPERARSPAPSPAPAPQQLQPGRHLLAGTHPVLSMTVEEALRSPRALAVLMAALHKQPGSQPTEHKRASPAVANSPAPALAGSRPARGGSPSRAAPARPPDVRHDASEHLIDPAEYSTRGYASVEHGGKAVEYYAPPSELPASPRSSLGPESGEAGPRSPSVQSALAAMDRLLTL